ncbi:MAG: hypothetical protein Q7R90_02670 [bacterium]|nr:hypothetical protein [bacterium]
MTLPSLESQARTKRKRVRIESVVLGSLAVAGVLSFAILAPNATRLLKHIDLSWAHKRDPRLRVRETALRLKKKGLLVWNTQKDRLELTSKGRAEAARIRIGLIEIPKPRKWDGRWRIVIFDISEKRRNLRIRVRHLLERLEFVRLQDSVWVHPYDCEEIVSILKHDFKIGRELLYIIADAVEYDRPLRKHFELPL